MTRILLVEGDDGEAADIEGTLRGSRDWEIVRVPTLLHAIRAAGEERFDAAVLDTDLPDGSGLDILDFLRIGSPGIRIMLLSARPNEEIAFHALSHGAGDFLAKDAHLPTELPLRMSALLDREEATGAFVETLAPVHVYETRAQSAPHGGPPDGLERALQAIVGGSVLAVGVWDLRGKKLAATAREGLDADGVGFALATLHGQVGALWTYGGLKPTGYRSVIDLEAGALAITAIPGTYVVAILVETGTPARRALDRLDEAALRILAALQGGTAGDDLEAG